MRRYLSRAFAKTEDSRSADEANAKRQTRLAKREYQGLSVRGSLLLGIVVLAFVLRIVGLANFPPGFTPDEASWGYDAYSLLKTGHDQWGQAWPLTFRSFGDFKLPLYAYLAIPSVAIFGLTEFAVRLPNVLFGTFAVLATYLMVKELFGHKSLVTNHLPADATALQAGQSLALIAAFFLAISPWHIALSRGAFEANMTTLLIPFGVWAFLKGLTKKKWMYVSAVVFGLNLFSYHSARIITPLLVISLIWFKNKNVALKIRDYKKPLSVFIVFLVVAGFTMLTGAGDRGADVAIFNPTDGWKSVADRRYATVLQGVPDIVSRVFSNKIQYVYDQFAKGYFSYLSPQFLFTEGAGEWTYGMIPGRGVLYLVEIVFVVVAITELIRRKKLSFPFNFLVIWILLSPIPAALSKGPGSAANRVAVMMPAIQILSAFGALILVSRFSKVFRKSYVSLVIIGVLSASLVFFLEDYRYRAPIHGAPSMLYGRSQMMNAISSIEGNYSEIVISRQLSEPHIFVAFYAKVDPKEYQTESVDWMRYEKEGRSFVDQLGEYKLGKYVFHNIDSIVDMKKTNSLLVGKPSEFSVDIIPLTTIYFPNGDPAMLIVDPTKQVYAKAN